MAKSSAKPPIGFPTPARLAEEELARLQDALGTPEVDWDSVQKLTTAMLTSVDWEGLYKTVISLPNSVEKFSLATSIRAFQFGVINSMHAANLGKELMKLHKRLARMERQLQTTKRS